MPARSRVRSPGQTSVRGGNKAYHTVARDVLGYMESQGKLRRDGGWYRPSKNVDHAIPPQKNPYAASQARAMILAAADDAELTARVARLLSQMDTGTAAAFQVYVLLDAFQQIAIASSVNGTPERQQDER